MRVLVFAFAALAGACAGASNVAIPGTGGGVAPNPFSIERGSALPPPTAAAAGQTAPAEGPGPGGLDFGAWRAADPASYSPQFQAQIRRTYAGQDAAQIRANLERNGFACENQTRLDCRIEIMERQCAIDWYVVMERAGAEPVAGFDRMCLGAQ